jgi:ankyrin repeat protein
MRTDVTNDRAGFSDALQGLRGGDFSRLEPLFDGDANSIGKQPRIIEWYEQGLFRDEPGILAETLTCACFLGRTNVAEYLLKHGVDPSGGAGTGLNAFHWAANRGQLEAVRLLIRWSAALEPRSMYGGNVLDTAVWSAINEPRLDHLRIIEELLKAGARLEDEEYPTGHEHVDAILRRYRAV